MPRPRFPYAHSLPIRTLTVVTLLLLSRPSNAQTLFSVGTGGTHTSIQAAIDACPDAGCTIDLTDSVYALPRELWIEGKKNLTLEGAPSLHLAGIRPRLHSDIASLMLQAGTATDPTDPRRPAGWKRWPVTCKDSVGGSKDSANPFSTSGYQYNGLVVVVRSQDIRLEGLTLDGIQPTSFGNKAVWDCHYDVFFGNVGVNLFQSRGVVLRDDDLRNFFAAIYINNRNPGGAVSSTYGIDGVSPVVPVLSASGTMGDHIVERNLIHHNWWAVYDEQEWDLGSTFRFNRIASNANTKYGTFVDFIVEAEHMAGGFLYVKDVPKATHRIHNNTIWGSPLVIGHGGYNYGAQHLFYNNIVGGFEQVIKNPNLRPMIGNYRQLLSYYGAWLDHNLFEARDSSARVGTQAVSNLGPVTDSSLCSTQHMLPPCYPKLDSSVNYRYIVGWLWPSWTVASNGLVRGKVSGNTIAVRTFMATEQFPGGGLIQSTSPYARPLDVSDAQNHWSFAVPWKSTTIGAPDFLEPDWSDSLTLRTIRGQGSASSGWPSTYGPADRGAIPASHAIPTLWSLRSQLPVAHAGVNCFRIPLQTLSGGNDAVARIHSAQAWSVPYMSGGTSVAPPPTGMRMRPLADSSFIEGEARTFCLDSTPSPANALRLHVDLSRTVAEGTEISETAYFVLYSPTAEYPVAVRRTSASGPSPRWLRTRDALVVTGLGGDGPVRLVVHTLDGRTLVRTTLIARQGSLTVALPFGGTTGSILVATLEQDGRIVHHALAPRVGF